MNKLAKLARKPAMKKVFGIFFAALMIVSMALPSFATEGTSANYDSYSDVYGSYSSEALSAMEAILEDITAALSISTIFKFLGGALAIAVGFFVFWWGTRKVIKTVRKAFASGKVSV